MRLINRVRRPIARISLAPNIPFDSKDDSNISKAYKMIVKEVARVSGQERPRRTQAPVLRSSPKEIM